MSKSIFPYFSLEIDVESNATSFIFFEALMSYLRISKEFCGRHLFQIIGLAKSTCVQSKKDMV